MMPSHVKGELKSGVWLAGSATGWEQSDELEAMLARLGFAVYAENAKARAELERVRLILARYPVDDADAVSMLGSASFSAPHSHLQFAVAQQEAHTAALAEGFHAALTFPVDECALVDALAKGRYIAVSADERQALRARIRELACDDDAVASRFIRLLIDTNRSTLAELWEAFRARSWDALTSGAHRLAGSARMLDCGGLFALLSRLEEAANAQQQRLSHSILQVIGNTIDDLEVSLHQLLATAPSW
jgi:HPt (histidine-containing phosphotransfer) domain-containing protein